MLQNLVSCFFVILLAVPCTVAAQQTPAEGVLRPKVVELNAGLKKELPILSGIPETRGMRSGLVALSHGESVGVHSTQGNEEILVVLEGSGEMVFGDGSKLPVRANSALYCPPHTQHNVINTGRKVLRYVYVVSRAE